MKINKWFVLYTSLIIILNIFCYMFLMVNPITFTQISQDKEATMAKYEHLWDDNQIVEELTNEREYKEGNVVASITIPDMDIYELPIYYGDSDINTNWQITTPGYEGKWDMFGEPGVTCVGAHNYQLFSKLMELQPSEKLIIETNEDVYVYEVTKTAIYDHTKDNWDDFTYNDASGYSLELMSCYPLGVVDTQDMYIVYAKMTRGTKFPQHI